MPRPVLAPAIWFKTANSQVVHNVLVEAGVTILRPPSEGQFGIQFTFVDPDGYAITAWPELIAEVAQGLVGIKAGDELIVLTWLHRAQREVLQVCSRGQIDAALMGVFATRSPDRPPRWACIAFRFWRLPGRDCGSLCWLRSCSF